MRHDHLFDFESDFVATLPAVSVEVLAHDPERPGETNGHPGVLYVVHREVSHVPTLTTAIAGHIEVRLGLPSVQMAGLYSPLTGLPAPLARRDHPVTIARTGRISAQPPLSYSSP